LNEPVSTWWKFGNNQEGCHFSFEAQSQILSELKFKMSESKCLISGPEENSISQTIESIENIKK
jgi:hypothetical protein